MHLQHWHKTWFIYHVYSILWYWIFAPHSQRGCCLKSLIFLFLQHFRGNLRTQQLLLIINLCTKSVVIQDCSIISHTVLPPVQWMLSARSYISVLGFWIPSVHQHKGRHCKYVWWLAAPLYEYGFVSHWGDHNVISFQRSQWIEWSEWLTVCY